MSRHLTDDELINIMYEVAESNPHLEGCDECRARSARMAEKRQALVAQPSISDDLLAQQRRRIYQRLDEGAGWSWMLRPSAAFVSVCVMLLAILLSKPQPAPEIKTLAVNDTQLFAEIYSVVEDSEPPAANPIYGLFEERQ